MDKSIHGTTELREEDKGYIGSSLVVCGLLCLLPNYVMTVSTNRDSHVKTRTQAFLEHELFNVTA